MPENKNNGFNWRRLGYILFSSAAVAGTVVGGIEIAKATSHNNNNNDVIPGTDVPKMPEYASLDTIGSVYTPDDSTLAQLPESIAKFIDLAKVIDAIKAIFNGVDSILTNADVYVSTYTDNVVFSEPKPCVVLVGFGVGQCRDVNIILLDPQTNMPDPSNIFTVTGVPVKIANPIEYALEKFKEVQDASNNGDTVLARRGLRGSSR